MKIAMVVPTLGFRGGIERHAFDFARSLRTRGHEIVLVHGAEQGRDIDAYAAGFDAVEPLAAPTSARRADLMYVHKAKSVDDVAALGSLPAIFVAHDHDLTCPRSHRYVPLGHKPCHEAAGLRCVGNGCVVVRDRRPGAFPLTLVDPFALRIRLRAMARRGSMVACSQYVADSLVAGGVPRERISVLHPIAPEDPTPTVAAPTERRLAVVGQLLRGKGVDLAIRALAHLPPDVKLSIAGDGPSRAELAALAAEVAPGRVELFGYVPPDDTRAVYDRARVVVVPSRWPEPFGMVGVEAMRRGRVVVGAAHGGIPEWLAGEGRGSRAFEPGNVLDLARAIRLALADDGAAALEHAQQTFSHDRAVGKLEALLGEAVRAAA